MSDVGESGLDAEQVEGLNDMDPEAFRAAAHTVVDRIADYLSTIESQAVLPADRARIRRPAVPGSTRRSDPSPSPTSSPTSIA